MHQKASSGRLILWELRCSGSIAQRLPKRATRRLQGSSLPAQAEPEPGCAERGRSRFSRAGPSSSR